MFFNACKKDSKEEPLSFNLIAVKDGKYGVINQDGNEILPFAYEYLSNMSIEGVMIHEYQDDLFELINIHGEVIETNLKELKPVHTWGGEPTSAYKGIKDYQWTIFDTQGQFFMYQAKSSYTHRQKFYSDKGFFSLNQVSKELVKTHQEIYQTSEDVYFTHTVNTTSVIDRHGQILYAYNFTELSRREHINFIYGNDGGHIFDKGGRLIYESNHLSFVSEVEGSDYLIIVESGLYGVINKDGERILNSDFLDIRIENHLIVAQSFTGGFDLYHDKAFLDHVNHFDFDKSYGYSNGVYLYYNVLDHKYYYYKNRQIIDGPHQSAYPFNDFGIALYKEASGAYVLVNTAFEVVNQTYRSYHPFGNYFIVQSHIEGHEDEYGIIDSDMNVVVPVQYYIDDITTLMSNFVVLEIELYSYDSYKEYYFIDQHGKIKRALDLSIEELMLYEFMFFDYYFDLMPLTPTVYERFFHNFLLYYSRNIPDGYQIVDFVHKDFLITVHEEKYGVLNSNFEVIIPFEYDNIITD
jgi:hypothetical protein